MRVPAYLTNKSSANIFLIPPCLKYPKNSGLTLLMFKQKYRLWVGKTKYSENSITFMRTSLNIYYHGIEHSILINSKETALLKKNEVFHEATSFSFPTTSDFLWMNSTNTEFHPLHFHHHHEPAKAEGAREPTSH